MQMKSLLQNFGRLLNKTFEEQRVDSVDPKSDEEGKGRQEKSVFQMKRRRGGVCGGEAKC